MPEGSGSAWTTPRIEILYSNMPGETEKLGIPIEYFEGKIVAEWFEDLRPGRLGRIAGKTLINEPSINELREMFCYDPGTGNLIWKVASDFDHIDNNGLNNRITNLREATRAQNQHNKRCKRAKNYKGVYWHRQKQKWHACIGLAPRCKKHLGYFWTARDAALAYDRAAREYFGEFAKCNFAD